MKEYNIRYRINGVGCLTLVANSAEEAEEEFDRIACGDSPKIEENEWITSDELYDIENDVNILDTKEK